jgi:hypothetical protein
MGTALAVMFMNAALAGAPHPSVPVPTHQAVPVRTHGQAPANSHGAQAIPNMGTRRPGRAGIAVSQRGTQQEPAANPGRHHHHQRSPGEVSVGYYDDGDAWAPCDDSLGDCPAHDVETWDQPVDQVDEDDGAGPADSASPDAVLVATEPAASNCEADGGSSNFQVDDGNGEAAIYHWIDADGEEHYSDAASVPDSARATARTTTGAPIMIAPRPACPAASPAAN